ncbi:MAG: AAA family ATPase, partial [Actinomycetia bacterium]|nr:AAA family ATPase [Actinomycetes bacterium]
MAEDTARRPRERRASETDRADGISAGAAIANDGPDAVDAVLAAERAHLLTANQCLNVMRAATRRIADYGVDALASESLGRLRAQRLRALAADPEAPPFFGRTDRDPDPGDAAGDIPSAPHAAPNGPDETLADAPADATRIAADRPDSPTDGPAEVLHIGRRHIRDRRGDPVVIDWRAPIARAFYQATPADRMGVRLRRRFGYARGELTSYEDEDLTRGEAFGLSSALLRAEIERPRVGPMRDIVATIQPDQDELVRAGLDTSLCVQGAPGSGKTAIGLHRAAYLLYTYPERLRRSGVLVIGPNSAFLRYIGQVLPALGEAGIEQTTLAELVGRVAVTAAEPTAVAVLKGDARLAEVLRRAVYSHVARPAEDLVLTTQHRRYRIGVERLRRYLDDARRAGVRWALARDRLRRQLAEDVRRQREDSGGSLSDADTAALARSSCVGEFVDAVWPALAAPALLTRLYTDEGFLRRCAGRALTDAELALLRRAQGRSPRAAAWTAADAVLIDELTGLLEPGPSWAHVVVDEAQDLSPM